ncbi:MAG: hypothetical protein JW946_01625 [Candidatus Omnitrophica bacterium]|nr:hypothetical protein [Candidatus Omnitrophota bacterium]
MKVQKDYEELLELFSKNKVKYFIVGAYAVAFYARPRYTKDIDILIEPTAENARKVIKSLRKFGFKKLNLAEEDFSRPGRIIQLGYEPVRIDIMTSIEGIDFKKAWKNREISNYGDQRVFFISKADLIKNKRESNRKQDRLDLEILSQLRK